MKPEVKRWVTKYVQDGKEYMREDIHAVSEEKAKEELKRLGRSNEKITGEFVSEQKGV